MGTTLPGGQLGLIYSEEGAPASLFITRPFCKEIVPLKRKKNQKTNEVVEKLSEGRIREGRTWPRLWVPIHESQTVLLLPGCSHPPDTTPPTRCLFSVQL